MTYEVPIERGKVREFARATKSKNPAFQGPSAVIPPTFLTTARLTWEPREDDQIGKLGLDLRRLLHAEEEYVFHGEPPRAGQTLTCETRLLDQWEKEGRRGGTMKFSRIVNEFRDATGQLVAEQRTTLVETARPPKEPS
jgi:hypothetical protein